MPLAGEKNTKYLSMSETPLAIGVDFGGTSVKFGVLYRSNIIDQAPAISTPDFDGPEALIAAMLRVIADLRDRHPRIERRPAPDPGGRDREQDERNDQPGQQRARAAGALPSIVLSSQDLLPVPPCGLR